MERIGLKHVVLLALTACAVVAAALLAMSHRGTWVARFSYFVAPGNGQIPFLNGNRELAERFCSDDFSQDVVAQCRARAVVKADEITLASVVTSATIRVSREGNGVLCDFSLSADSRRLVEEVSKCYLAAMYKTIDWENRKIVEKATSEMSVSLAKHEELAKKAKSNYDDARDAGNELLEKHKNDMEKLRAECEALRRKISEIRLAASKGTNSLVIVQPLSVERAIK